MAGNAVRSLETIIANTKTESESAPPAQESLVRPRKPRSFAKAPKRQDSDNSQERPGAPRRQALSVGAPRSEAEATSPSRQETARAPTPTSAAEVIKLRHALKAQDEVLDRIERDAQSINASVQFTEAYLTVGLAQRMSDVLRQEVGAAERWCAAHARQKTRTHRARLLALLIAGLFALELATGLVAPYYETSIERTGEIAQAALPRLKEWSLAGLALAEDLWTRILQG